MSSTGAGDRRKPFVYFGLIFVLALVVWAFTAHFRFSFTNSCGAHFFWKIECPVKLRRGLYVSVTPTKNDPYLPEYVRYLMKRIYCLPGETVERKGLHFWCRTREMKYDMGLTKLKTRKGKAIRPFTYGAGASANYTLAGDEIFVLGLPVPASYDSRYFGPVKRERIEGCYKALF